MYTLSNENAFFLLPNLRAELGLAVQMGSGAKGSDVNIRRSRVDYSLFYENLS